MFGNYRNRNNFISFDALMWASFLPINNIPSNLWTFRLTKYLSSVEDGSALHMSLGRSVRMSFFPTIRNLSLLNTIYLLKTWYPSLLWQILLDWLVFQGQGHLQGHMCFINTLCSVLVCILLHKDSSKILYIFAFLRAIAFVPISPRGV